MNTRQILLATVLLAFTAYSLFVVEQVGYLGLWLIGDARRRGVAAWPWLLAILLLGSIGLLAYLFVRERGMLAHPAH